MDPYVSQVQLFGFNFAPQGWAQCNGQLMPIQQNTALFSLLGTTYGGNGSTTYALPNLQGSAVCAQGQGPGLSQRSQGESFGSPSITLLSSEMPAHTHPLNVFGQRDDSKRHGSPSAGDALVSPTAPAFTTNNLPPTGPFSAMAVPVGGNQPHENRQPYLAMNFCIALVGIYPPRP